MGFVLDGGGSWGAPLERSRLGSVGGGFVVSMHDGKGRGVVAARLLQPSWADELGDAAFRPGAAENFASLLKGAVTRSLGYGPTKLDSYERYAYRDANMVISLSINKVMQNNEHRNMVVVRACHLWSWLVHAGQTKCIAISLWR